MRGATEVGEGERRHSLAGYAWPVGRFNFASERRLTVCELNMDVRMAASQIGSLKLQRKTPPRGNIPLVGVEWI